MLSKAVSVEWYSCRYADCFLLKLSDCVYVLTKTRQSQPFDDYWNRIQIWDRAITSWIGAVQSFFFEERRDLSLFERLWKTAFVERHVCKPCYYWNKDVTAFLQYWRWHKIHWRWFRRDWRKQFPHRFFRHRIEAVERISGVRPVKTNMLTTMPASRSVMISFKRRIFEIKNSDNLFHIVLASFFDKFACRSFVCSRLLTTFHRFLGLSSVLPGSVWIVKFIKCVSILRVESILFWLSEQRVNSISLIILDQPYQVGRYMWVSWWLFSDLKTCWSEVFMLWCLKMLRAYNDNMYHVSSCYYLRIAELSTRHFSWTRSGIMDDDDYDFVVYLPIYCNTLEPHYSMVDLRVYSGSHHLWSAVLKWSAAICLVVQRLIIWRFK